ncbi:MAG: hypothetical protein IJB44_03380 [Clostridia bacterium]|nr:hypothetical protein [Clostridia bacterium]
MNGKYDDIIDLPHHVSPTRPQMPIADRAAQFSPFAALTGYDDEIKETARLTDDMIEMNEEALNMLNMKFQMLIDRLNDKPKVIFTYFQPDERKDGGAFLTIEGVVKKVDVFERIVILQDGTKLQMDNVLDIDGEIFKGNII